MADKGTHILFDVKSVNIFIAEFEYTPYNLPVIDYGSQKDFPLGDFISNTLQTTGQLWPRGDYNPQ